MKKYPKSEADHASQLVDQPGYISWASDPVAAFDQYGKTIGEFRGISRKSEKAIAHTRVNTFDGLTDRVSGRPGLTLSDCGSFLIGHIGRLCKQRPLFG